MSKREKIQFAIGAIGVPIAIGGFAMLDSHPLIAIMLLIIAGVAFIWGISVLLRKRHRKTKMLKQETVPLPKVDYDKVNSVSAEDKKLIQSIIIRMSGIHGHMDRLGLLSDRANGVPVNELMAKPCSLCGIQRNKKGNKINAL